MGLILQAFLNIFVSIFNFLNVLLNYPMRMKIIKSYSPDFGVGDWVLLGISNLLLLAVIVLGAYFIIKQIKKLFSFRIPAKENERLKAEVAKLSREVFKLNYEKDKILAMKVAEMGIKPGDLMFSEEDIEGQQADNKEEKEEEKPESARNTVDSPPVVPESSRFFRLTTVDNYYKTEYKAPEYDNDITLEGFCERYRNYAASRLRLYYDIDILRYFVAALGACRLIILQGISGTGKTSLPYSFGKYLMLDSTIAAVQPAWRDRTELFGYFNEFTKVFNETEFLRAVYEANYFKDPHVIVLDEMNIARVEYYFAEMLSVLEMPRSDEWLIDIVTTVWDNDPCLINSGKIKINQNTWFVGTINNDDSTFAVADKVYDRAIPIDLDTKAAAFTAPDTEPIHITAEHLISLFNEAKKKYPISEENMKKLEDMDQYVIKHFRLAFGNRIMKQLKDFVPCYVACGGTEIDGIDFMVAKKILRKFESLNMGFIKDELHKFIIYLEKTFGKTNMTICREYLNRMQRMS
jgi:nitrate reductase cytochrome c-type subunit